jgi:hypothetical protein
MSPAPGIPARDIPENSQSGRLPGGILAVVDQPGFHRFIGFIVLKKLSATALSQPFPLPLISAARELSIPDAAGWQQPAAAKRTRFILLL